MDGIELTRAIRAHATRSTLPVVIVTIAGRRTTTGSAGSRPAPTPTWSSRQFDQHDLLETVERLVGR